jgi:hypothetical protein
MYMELERMWRGEVMGSPEALSQHLPGGFQEDKDKSLLGYSISGPRFEPATSRIRVNLDWWPVI